MQINAAAGWLN